jgi:pyruvate formate lyase activating enzyme
MNGKVVCTTCMHRCALNEGQTGWCRARTNNGSNIVCSNYGKLTALSLDPIEKKPLRLFHPGSWILSAGSYGCNLACPFCQNCEISQSDETEVHTEIITPEELCAYAKKLADNSESCKNDCALSSSSAPHKNIGVAYTYNEPLVGWEFVRDTAKLIHKARMLNVIVTNGSVLPAVLDEVLPYTDAMNIDLKGFTDEWYKKLGGDLQTVKDAIIQCAAKTHVELTTLIVPGCNDSAPEMHELASWVASVDKNIALHVTRFFPRFKMENAEPTDVSSVFSLADVAREHLTNVFTGNC